jgi:hypothetical protein
MSEITEDPSSFRYLDDAEVDRFPGEHQDAYRYAAKAFDYGMQYLGAGRFAVASGFMPIGAGLLHHAIEMFLKGLVARGAQPADIRQFRRRYGHKLGVLWREVLAHFPNKGLESFADTIARLDEFEDIRYPDKLISGGAIIETGFSDDVGSSGGLVHPPVERHLVLSIPKIDRLVKRLFELAQFNPEFFSHMLRDKHAAKFFAIHNESLLVQKINNDQ